MPSARLASLLEQRKLSKGLQFGDNRRILAPANNAIATIARKTAATELESMVGKYNNGLVTNEDMRAFLEKMTTNPGLSESDRLDVTTQLRDFDNRIQGDKLNAEFKAAPDNSIAQVQAVQRLISYHRNRAGGMASGTPAQSQALENSAVWEQKLVDINKSMATLQRRNLRYSEEEKVNQLPNNSAERSYARSQMYKKLYDDAVASGDTVDASKYASYYQQELTNAEEQGIREQEQEVKAAAAEDKKKLSDAINTTMNDYHDGKISGDDALAQLEEANKFAYDNGDTAALNRLNGLSITINREIDKGIVYTSVNGLSQKSKGGGGGGELYLNPDGSLSMGGTSTGGSAKSSSTRGGGVGTTKTSSGIQANTKLGGSGESAKSLSQLDIEYKNDTNEANKALQEGQVESNGKTAKFTSKDYMEAITIIEKNRQLQLQSINKGLDQLAATGVKKVGGKQIETLRETYAAEYQKSTIQYNGLRTGNLVLAMKSGDFTNEAGVKVSKPQLQLVNKSETGKMIEANGIYQPLREEKKYLTTDQEMKQFQKNNPGIELKNDDMGTYYNNRCLM